MKILLINGSPNEFGCTYTALAEAQTVFEKNGIETDMIYLGKKPVAGCIACGFCRKAGLCAFDDKVNDIIDDLDEIDGITIDVPSPNSIIISGADKQMVGQFAAEVREKRPPEPYKGKGIKYADEVIRRKEGKAGKGAKK